MGFSCIITDWGIYHRVRDVLGWLSENGDGEYVFDSYINGPDNRLYGYRYRCMGTDTVVALIPIYRQFRNVVTVRGGVEQDVLTQMDKLEIPSDFRKIVKSSD